MKRREFLSLSSVGLLTASSGCTALGLDTGVPEGMTVESHHWATAALEKGVETARRSGVREPIIAVVVLDDQATASDRIDPESPAADFIVETDFERSYVALVEYFGTSSSKWLEYRSIELRDSELHVVAEVVSPDGATFDNLAIHSLALRITDGNHGVPSGISAEVVSCGFIRCTDHL